MKLKVWTGRIWKLKKVSLKRIPNKRLCQTTKDSTGPNLRNYCWETNFSVRDKTFFTTIRSVIASWSRLYWVRKKGTTFCRRARKKNTSNILKKGIKMTLSLKKWLAVSQIWSIFMRVIWLVWRNSWKLWNKKAKICKAEENRHKRWRKRLRRIKRC